jgi:dienelactone hydrolase
VRTLLYFVLSGAAVAAAQQQRPESYQPTEAELRQVQSKSAELADALKKLERDPLYAEVAIYRKAAEFIVRHPEEFITREFLTNTLAILDKGIVRARELQAGSPSWTRTKGRLVRAFVSAVDGSVQPYGLIIPDSYSSQPIRLDVWLHGMNRNLNEVLFMTQHESAAPVPPEQSYIQLDVYGRSNNSYRWAGETDVFEAIQSVRERYKIDPRRITIRGFSMGGAGAWHLGLHHPDRWAAFEAGAGYTETKIYAKKTSLPVYQEAALHYYDAVDYSLNGTNLPFVAYGGEIDAQLQASLNIKEQLVKEGINLADIRALFLVGPQTGHSWHRASKKESDHFIDQVLAEGLTPPPRIRFVTYTTRFNRCFWITVEGLEKHYQRAEVDSTREASRTTVATKNVARIRIDGSGLVTLDGQDFPGAGVFNKANGKWVAAAPLKGLHKRHALQGPIDDAFVESFLCVRPTGKETAATEYAVRELNSFTKAFAKWLRGDPRVKDDRAISPADIAEHNLILFGDPWSNSVIARVIGKLPVKWTKEEITVGGQTFSTNSHTPALIYPNPLNPNRYVVINSGHTFSDSDWRGTNANLYPHLGDYAVMAIATREAVFSGFFDERWK